MNEDGLTTFGEKVMASVQRIVDKTGLDKNRLPMWVESPKVTFIEIDSSIIIHIEDDDEDQEIKFEYTGGFEDYLQYLFPGYEITKWKSHFDMENLQHGQPPSNIVSIQVIRDGGAPVSEEIPEGKPMYDLRDGKYHVPVAINDYAITIERGDKPVKRAYCPLTLLVHKSEFQFPELILNRAVHTLSKKLRGIHEQETGSYYSEHRRNNEYITKIEDSVLVLGAFDKGEFETELKIVRDELRERGYKANLITDLPAHPAQPLPRVVKMWALTSRFCVVVDRDASGHLVEYTELKSEEVPLALLRPKDDGSTRMIGHENRTHPLVEKFQFNESPIEVLGEVTEWVETEVSNLEEALEVEYPWR